MNKALLRLISSQAAVSYGVSAPIPFDQAVYDSGGFYAGTPGSLVIPAGVSFVRVGGCAVLSSVAASSGAELSTWKNGQPNFDGTARLALTTSPDGRARLPVSSGPIPVVEGDVFQLALLCTDTSINVLNPGSSFWIEDAS